MAGERVAAVKPMLDDLQRIFNRRLQAVVTYGAQKSGPVPTLALVSTLDIDDLNECANHVGRWQRGGAATPLLLTRADFERSLDAFPIEFGEIIEHHEVVYGDDPFAGLAIAREDLRRACEVQVKSLLLHLREDYLESGGRRAEIDALVRESAAGFAALVRLLARLDGITPGGAPLADYVEQRLRLDSRTVGDLFALADAQEPSSVDAIKLFPAYLAAVERLAGFVDQWRAT
jgi:hypothetical protein